MNYICNVVLLCYVDTTFYLYYIVPADHPDSRVCVRGGGGDGRVNVFTPIVGVGGWVMTFFETTNVLRCPLFLGLTCMRGA